MGAKRFNAETIGIRIEISYMASEISRLKQEKNAVIVAHNYQIDEVQEIADMVGDSFELSKYCANSPADTIVFCGVHFMAESAKILSPHKTVLLPEKHAGCPMADMITVAALREKKQQHPDAAIVCYINSSAAVKAESDICCTSTNAVKIIQSIKQKDILFVPDCNLGSYIAKMVPDKNIILWEGYCIVHHRVRAEDVTRMRGIYRNAVLIAHPECREEVTASADFVGSTKQMIDYVAASDAKEFIVGTETGILYTLKKENPDKKFYPLSQGLVCNDMKKITVESVYRSLNTMTERIDLDEDIRIKAFNSLDKMLKIA